MKLQLRDAELEADGLAKRLARYDKTLRELQFERSFLLEKLHEIQNGSAPGSDVTSESEEEVIVGKVARMKPEKDPNAPKRPANAFFMFCQLERGKLRESNQEASLSELTKILGLRWKDMSKEEKQVYYEMYETDKLRYEKEMSSYTGPGGGSIPRRLEDDEECVLEAPASLEVEEEPVDSQDEESGSADSSPYSEESS
ncbi:non-histone protein, variant 2 [Entomophthora muscae]|nr:non-histone protein, variant 2 [Entomophthora muscae]